MGLCVAAVGCSDNPPGPIEFGPIGSLTQPSGRGSFRFGAATAAVQIEDGLTNDDWYYWTLPASQGGSGQGAAFVDDAVMGATRAQADIQLLSQMHLDAYRFSIDWSRVEPQRGVFSQQALDHYGQVIDGLVAAGIRPMITIHHFSSPLWVDDFIAEAANPSVCDDTATPTNTNLCGWGHPQGADMIISELASFAGLLAKTYGDRVDEWCTLNEPINYLLASYGIGNFPPGKAYLLSDSSRLVDIMRNYLRAHVAIYDAIKANDTVDADGDGSAADVGLCLSAVDWMPAHDGQPSDDPVDVAARDRVWYVFHYLFPDALEYGGFDANLDGVQEESHPDWAGKLDWLGVQYYFRAGVTGSPGIVPLVQATPCFSGIPVAAACLPSSDPTHYVPAMGYEFYEKGIYDVLTAFSQRYPDLPLVVTESGIATTVGARRAEAVVRILEQIHRARQDGADVRGYYHWSLMDNFEWDDGFTPKFGLYSVDLSTYDRTPTEGATVYGDIAAARTVTSAERATYGGTGPMTPEPTP